MNKLKLASGVLLVFLVGALAGSLGTGYYYKKRVETFEKGGLPVEQRFQIILGRFSNELDLTNKQRTEFEKIIRESQEKQMNLASQLQPEIKQINDDTFTNIKDKLTDEQKTRLEELIKRMDEVRERFPSGQRQQQRTPDKSRPQQQGGPEQGHQQVSPQQGPPQGAPDQNHLVEIPYSAPPKGGEPDVGRSEGYYMRFFNNVKDQLNLSPEQEESVRAIMQKSSDEQKKVVEKYRADLQKIEESIEKSLSNILTKDQTEKYQKAKESREDKMFQPGVP